MIVIRDQALREMDQLFNDLTSITPGRYRRYRNKLEEADAALALANAREVTIPNEEAVQIDREEGQAQTQDGKAQVLAGKGKAAK